MTDWRYWITYEGIVTTISDREEEAIQAAYDDVANGKIGTIELEEVGEGE